MSTTCIITFVYESVQRTANAKSVAGDFDTMYRVVMDDGYENTFFTTIERPYEWYEETVGYTELAQAVGKAIEKTFL